MQVELSGHISVLLAISRKRCGTFCHLFQMSKKKDYSSDLPKDWMFDVSMKGFMINKLFLKWFLKGFVPSVGSRRSVLLL